MDFTRVKSDAVSLEKYCSLFQACFPNAKHYSINYLKWLYKDNPDGEVVGFDAFNGDELAAHYVCIPIVIALRGEQRRALLSLNTATHPRHQGKGLFTRLAKLTYELGAGDGYECVIGVANANSTPGFVKKLGFQLVAPLKARVGFGKLGVTDWDAVLRATALRRTWSRNSMEWRIRNPMNAVRAGLLRGGGTCAWAATQYHGISVWAEIPQRLTGAIERCLPWIAPRVFIGMFPGGSCSYSCFWTIPDFLKPAPLNFIYKNFQQSTDRLETDKCLISFLDFDAY